LTRLGRRQRRISDPEDKQRKGNPSVRQDKRFPPPRQAKGDKGPAGPAPKPSQPALGGSPPPKALDSAPTCGADDIDLPADDDIPFDFDRPGDDADDPYRRVSFTEFGELFRPPPPNVQAQYFRDCFIAGLGNAVAALERRLGAVEDRLDAQDGQRVRDRLTVIKGDKP
jgi:hypothetical protein